MSRRIGEIVHFAFGGCCYPAIIVRAWSSDTVNLKVIDDGPFGSAATYSDWTPDRASVSRGQGQSQSFTWHPREECATS
mgnify:CR=1 FL=1